MSLGLALSGGSIFGAAWMASVVFLGRFVNRPYRSGTSQRAPRRLKACPYGGRTAVRPYSLFLLPADLV
jgi:hypothetical protein